MTFPQRKLDSANIALACALLFLLLIVAALVVQTVDAS